MVSRTLLSIAILTMCVPTSAGLFLGDGEGGLSVYAFITPEGGRAGDLLTIQVQAFMWSAPTDVDSITAYTGFYQSVNSSFERTSAGVYRGTMRLALDSYACDGAVDVHIDVTRGTLSASNTVSYPVRYSSTERLYDCDWYLTARIANDAELGHGAKPGSTVVIEGRTYFNGSLKDGGVVNASSSFLDGSANATVQILAGTRVAAGTYQFSIPVPGDLGVSRIYTVSVSLGSSYFREFATVEFVAHPFPIFAYAEDVTDRSATVRVWAGDGSAAFEGARIDASGKALTYLLGQVDVDMVRGTLDKSGGATLQMTWGKPAYPIFELHVAYRGATAIVLIDAIPPDPATWLTFGGFGYGCEMWLAGDPTIYRPGDTAALRMKITVNGTPVASKPVARFVYRELGGAVELAGNATTTSGGEFTVNYVIPADWRADDKLHVVAVCPTGSLDEESIEFVGGAPPPKPTPTLTVAEPAKVQAGSALQVSAQYAGNSSLEGVVVVAELYPGDDPASIAGTRSGQAPTAVLTRSGTSFSGSLAVPSWMPGGTYVLVVNLTNDGASAEISDAVEEEVAVLVEVEAAPAQSGAGGSALLLGGVAAAGAAGAIGVFLVQRKRKARAALAAPPPASLPPASFAPQPPLPGLPPQPTAPLAPPLSTAAPELVPCPKCGAGVQVYAPACARCGLTLDWG